MGKKWAIVVLILALLVVGFFLRGPMPEILLPAEVVAHFFGFPLSNTIIAAWLTMLILLIPAWLATRKTTLVPRGLQNFMELVVETALNFVEGVAGKKNGRRFFPLVSTIFLFILVSNWSGLLPGFGTIGVVEEHHHGYPFQQVSLGGLKLAFLMPGTVEATEVEQHASSEGSSEKDDEENVHGVLVPFLRGANTNLNTPLALALVVTFFIEFWGIRSQGFLRFMKRYFNFNLRALKRGDIITVIVDGFVGLLEIVSDIARVISLSFRLFGNMFAGEVLVLIITFLIPWVMVLVFYGLELIVGFMQAFIFALLALLFSVMAVTEHGTEEHAPASEGHEARH